MTSVGFWVAVVVGTVSIAPLAVALTGPILWMWESVTRPRA